MKVSSKQPSLPFSDLGACVRRALNRPVRRRNAAIVALSLAGLATQPAAAGPFPAEIELSSLLGANGGDGSVGMAVNGIDISDNSGLVIGPAGDVNDDGIVDILITSRSAESGAGETYVVFGTDQGVSAEFELSALLGANGGDGSSGFVIRGIDAGDRSGTSASAAGDVNGDGIADLIIGASDADPANPTRGGTPPTRINAGEAYIVYGTDQGFAAEFELSSLIGGNGSTGFVLNGIDSGDRAGLSVSAAGDINDDGTDDFLVAAPSADEVYLIFGRDLGFPASFDLSTLQVANGGDGSAGVILRGQQFQQLGRALSRAGDINGDDIDDAIIAMPVADIDANYDIGRTYVLFGHGSGFTAEFDMTSLHADNGGDGSAGFVLNGINPQDEAGRSVSAAGDVNGDDFDDIIIGTRRGNPTGVPDAGQSYVIFGTDQGFDAEIDLSSLLASNGGNSSAGFVLNGAAEANFAGFAVSGAGDVNGDSLNDVIIGAYYASPGGRDYAGETYVVFGQTGFPAEFELATLLPANGGDGNSGFVLNGIEAEDYSGKAVGAAGDFNGDGIADVLTSTEEASPGGRIRTGQTYMIFGRPTLDADADGIANDSDNCVTVFNPSQCNTNGDNFGNACDADLDNNNWVNFDDLGLFADAFMSTPMSATWNADADFNCDDVVNFEDLNGLGMMFFMPPGPAADGN